MPIFFSIEEMRNLSMTIAHTHEGDYINCKVFNLFQELLPISRSGHTTLDLPSFVRSNQPSAYVDPGNEWNFQCSSAYAAAPKMPVRPQADPSDLDKGNPRQDHWTHIPGRHRLIRVHVTKTSFKFFIPQEKASPVPVEQLKQLLKTVSQVFMMIAGKVSVEPLEKPWTGKPPFRI